MGAWPHLRLRFGETIGTDKFPLRVISRPASASPATGSSASHKIEQRLLIDETFAIPEKKKKRARARKGEN